MKELRVANNQRRAMPAKLRAKAAQAKERHQKRAIAPDVGVTVTAQGWQLSNPYRHADEPAWWCLFLEAFGTRHGDVANAFLNHLSRLCSMEYDHERGGWKPNEDELLAAIAIVQSQKPRNEAEAALAAQAVALHFAAMKVGRYIGTVTYPDARTLASLAAVGKAFSGNLETMHKLKGRRSARQRITVHHEKHVHHHQHVHVEGGGAKSGGQSHAPIVEHRTGGNGSGSALPGQNEGGRIVLLPGREGEGALPNARGKVRRSQG